jgi:hypothetical protein
MSTYLKSKINLHPSDVESLMNALLEAGWEPKDPSGIVPAGFAGSHQDGDLII